MVRGANSNSELETNSRRLTSGERSYNGKKSNKIESYKYTIDDKDV